MRCEIVEDGVRCLNVAAARGMCHTHYTRWRKYGDPLVVHVRGRSPTEVMLHSFEEVERVTAEVRREARWITMQILVGMANDAART